MSATMPGNNQQLSRIDRIEEKIDKRVTSEIAVTPNRGVNITTLDQAMELAKLMAIAGSAVPKHLRGNPGACLAVALQGMEWGINPFAIANKSYEVNDRLGYESALYHAVVLRRAPIVGRIRTTYRGTNSGGTNADRVCHVEATLTDGTGNVDYTSPPIGTIRIQNSPLWKADPDQQLFYYSVRAFARRHFPDVMMGIYTADELIDADPMPNAPPRGMEGLRAKVTDSVTVTARPVSEGQTLDTSTGQLSEDEAERVLQDAADRAKSNQQPQAVSTVTEPTEVQGNAPTANEADESDLPSDLADVAIREAVEDPDTARKSLIAVMREKAPTMTRSIAEGHIFRWATPIGGFPATTVEQRMELLRQVKAGTFPAK